MSTSNGATEGKSATEAPVQQPQQALSAQQAQTPLIPQNLGQAWELAAWLARSDVIPKNYQGKPSNVLAAIYMGHDLGVSPMQAMREIYVVHGRPQSSALLKVALVKQSPLCKVFRMVASATSDKQATFETQRVGEPEPVRHVYTLEDAKKAGLYPGEKDSNWSKRPTLMLRRRCQSELCDDVYPDVVKGLRTEDEGEEIRAAELQRETWVERAPVPVTVAPPPPRAPAPEAAPVVDQRPPEQPRGAPAAGAPDPVDVFLADLGQVDGKGIDEMRRRLNDLVPKGHPRRDEVGRAINAASARIQGA